MQDRTLYTEGRFFQGNLHTHSTLSDGRNPPEELVAYYRDTLHYDFLAVTDHGKFIRHDDLATPGFLLLPGVEVNTIPSPDDRPDHHVVGIGVDSELSLPEGEVYGEIDRTTCQSMIDTLGAHGFLTIFCHPHWSAASTEEAKALRNVTGMEILNYSCHTGWRTGYAEPYYDAALWSGNKMWAFATDDAHLADSFQCGGSIVVKCAELTNAAVTQAIRDGSFYATSGPRIHDFYVEDGVAHVECSDAAMIHLIGYIGMGCALARENETINRFDQPLVYRNWRHYPDSLPPFVRAVVTDHRGRVAWSQPVIVSDPKFA